MSYPHYRSIGRNYPTAAETTMQAAKVKNVVEKKILDWIELRQSGKSEIYPYRVAQNVAVHFNLPMHDAMNYVLIHIKAEMNYAYYSDEE